MTEFQPKPQTPEQVADGLRDAMRQAIKDGVMHIPDGFHLSDKEVEDLRKSKKELTEYGKQKLRKLMTEPIHAKVSDEDFQKIVEAFDNPQPYPDEMFEEAARREEENKRPFYRFFAIEYFATGEGMSFWLKVCRNYPPYKTIADTIVDHDLERFVKFIGEGAEYYIHGLTQPTEEEFMTQYANLIPAYIVKMIERKDQPALDWETHFHFNYS